MSNSTNQVSFESQGYLKPVKKFTSTPSVVKDSDSGHYEEIENYSNLNQKHECNYNELNFDYDRLNLNRADKLKNFLKSLVSTRKKRFILIGILSAIGLIILISVILLIIFTTSNDKTYCCFFSKIFKSNLKKIHNDVDPCILNRCDSIRICSPNRFLFGFIQELCLFKKKEAIHSNGSSMKIFLN